MAQAPKYLPFRNRRAVHERLALVYTLPACLFARELYLVTTRKIYTPRAYAPMATEFMLRHQRCNLWAKPGMGKTVMAYTVIDAMYLLGLETRPTLVLGPKRVATDVWPDEVEKWVHLRDITVSAICGDKKQRERALKREASVYTTNYENLPWLVEHLGDKWPFGTVIADESVKIKSFRLRQGGKRAQALAKVSWTHVNRWLNLTGYPAPNGLKDLWGQMWFIDQGRRLGRSFSAFQQRWFRTGYDGFGLVALPHAQREIEDLIRDVTLTLDPVDWFDLRKPVHTVIPVKLPPLAMKMYKDFEKTMFTELNCGAELEVFNAAALTNKCLQIANGFAYHEGGTKWFHDAKIEALENLVDEIGEPVLVATAFVEDQERLVKIFGNRCALLATKEGMKAFKSGNVQIGLANPGSVGHGTDGLQGVCNSVIFYGHDWNLDNRIQFIERVGEMRQFQAGLDRPVFVYDLVAQDTIEEDVMVRNEGKFSVQQILQNAMKRLSNVGGSNRGEM